MYSTPQEIWRYFGKDAYNVVRSETLGTGNGVLHSWTTSQINLISGSTALYEDGVEVTSSYSIDLDEGKVEFTASSGSVLTADYDYADVPDSTIQSLITASDSLIEEKTGRKFTQETGNTEYVSLNESQKTVYLRNYPVLTLSSVSSRTGSTFNALTEGYEDDYIANDYDLVLGRIRLNTSQSAGEDRLKIVYDYGYTSTPPLINELSKLLTIRQLANSSVYKSIFKGYDNFTPIRLDEIEARIEELFRLYIKQEIDTI